MTGGPEPEAIIRMLGMQPHPEGGWYVETWRDRPPGGGRGAATAIYFLLAARQRSHWHKVDASELWLWHAGGPLRLDIAWDGQTVTSAVLGPDLAAGERPQLVVPAHAWQAAEPLGAWVLVSCVVAPAFEFRGFELAPAGWRLGGS
ncbi:MAG TPA: cupin domain-containing protein [Geminicoccaceae bacterium]|nr:cupin domain-containing protein [Geminicoccaceae bacterium]